MICEMQNVMVIEFGFFLLKYLRPSFFYENRLILNSSKLTVGEKNQSCDQLLEIVVNEKCSL